VEEHVGFNYEALVYEVLDKKGKNLPHHATIHHGAWEELLFLQHLGHTMVTGK
jgi:hypothetical protein